MENVNDFGSWILTVDAPAFGIHETYHIPAVYQHVRSVLNQYLGPKIKHRKLNDQMHDFTWTEKTSRGWVGEVLQTFRAIPAYGSYSCGIGRTYGSGGVADVAGSRVPNLAPSVYYTALSRFYEKWHGDLDVSIDLYQYKQSVKLAEDIYAAVKYVRTFRVDKLKKSFDAWNRRTSKPKYSDVVRRGGSIFATNDSSLTRGTGRAATSQFNRQTRSKWRDISREAGSLWLAYSYGLKPTCQTVYDTIIELARNMEPLMKVTGSAVEGDHYGDTFRDFVFGHDVEVKVVRQWSYRCKFSALFSHSANTVQLLSRFTTLNPLGFVWENTPFSFCVDWFYDVGGYLRNIETSMLAGPAWRGGFCTDTESWGTASMTEAFGFHEPFHFYYEYDWTLKADAWSRHKWHRRRVLTEPPFPNLPTFKVDFSNPQKALNAVSLLAQFLGGKR